ncbi:MAG: TonB-dependent receptor domain-containing protein, partial [bacterium]
NRAGEFEINRVPFGIYTLRISMIGYANKNVAALTIHEETAPLRIELEESPIEIDPVVISVSKWEQDADNTPAAVEVLTAKDILQRSPLRIEDALETAAGVQILQENVNIRGSDGWTFGIGGRVLVMMDGVPLMSSDMGSVNWFMVSPADIERAEIVRGAGSAIYGSSAMGGVINFITRKPTPKSRTYIRTMAGVYDDFKQPGWDWTDNVLHYNRQDFTHSRQIGHLGLRVSGGRSYSTGYTQNGSYERYNISGRFNYRFQDNSELTFFGNYMHDDSDVFVVWRSQIEATRVAAGEADKHQTRSGSTLFAKYHRLISSKAAVEIRTFLNRFLIGTQATDVDFSPALGLGGAIQGTYLPSNTLSFTWGSDFKLDRVKSDAYGQRNALLTAPYLQADWRLLPNLNMTLGGRYDRYKIFAEPDTSFRLNEARVYDHISPKIGLNFHPFRKTTLKGSISNGFKFPVIFQLFFDNQEITNITFVANETLRSETSWSYELGLKQKITPAWFIELNGFYTDVHDLIEPQAISDSTATFLNTTEVGIPGFEFVSNSRWWHNRLGLRVNLTYLNPHNKETNNLLKHRQKLIAFIGASVQIGKFEFQADFKYGSPQEDYLLPGGHQFVSQKVVDVRVLYNWKQFTFLAGVNNVGNYAYTLRDRFLEENRNFLVGLTAEF